MPLSPLLFSRLPSVFNFEDRVPSPTPSLSSSPTCIAPGSSPSDTPPYSRGTSPLAQAAFLKVESPEHLLSFETDFDFFGDSHTHKDSLLSAPTTSTQIQSALADIEYFFPTPTTAERGRGRISPPSPSRWQGEDNRGGREQADSSFPRSGLRLDPALYSHPYNDTDMYLAPSGGLHTRDASYSLHHHHHPPASMPSSATSQYEHMYPRGGPHYAAGVGDVRAPRSLHATSLPGSTSRGMTTVHSQHNSHPESIQQALVHPPHRHGYANPAFQQPRSHTIPAGTSQSALERPTKRLRSATEEDHVTPFPPLHSQYAIPMEVIIPAATDETASEAAQRRGKGRERPKPKGTTGITVSSRRSSTNPRDTYYPGPTLYPPPTPHHGPLAHETAHYDTMSHHQHSTPPTFVQFQATSRSPPSGYSQRDQEMKGNTVDLYPEGPFEHPPTDLPPRMYSGGGAAHSPWKPQKPVGKIPGSALDYLPILEARFDRLERAVDGYVEYRSQQALANSKLPGVTFHETSLPTTHPDRFPSRTHRPM